MVIGQLEGYDVIYDPSEDSLFCKNTKVRAERLLRAYEAATDRNNVESNLVMRKNPMDITLGCFSISKDIGKQLIKQIKDVRKRTAEERTGANGVDATT